MRNGARQRLTVEVRLLPDHPSREEALVAASNRPSVTANVFGIPGAA